MASNNNPSKAEESAASLQGSDDATLTFNPNDKSFELIITGKHHGIGQINDLDGISTINTVPSPRPAVGTFHYDSWDKVLHAELRFAVYKVDESRPDTDIHIVFSEGDVEVAKYIGESHRMQGGTGSFKWLE